MNNKFKLGQHISGVDTTDNTRHGQIVGFLLNNYLVLFPENHKIDGFVIKNCTIYHIFGKIVNLNHNREYGFITKKSAELMCAAPDLNKIRTSIYTYRNNKVPFNTIQLTINKKYKTDYALSSIESMYYVERRKRLAKQTPTMKTKLIKTVLTTDNRKPSEDKIEALVREEYGLSKDVKLSINVKIG